MNITFQIRQFSWMQITVSVVKWRFEWRKKKMRYSSILLDNIVIHNKMKLLYQRTSPVRATHAYWGPKLWQPTGCLSNSFIMLNRGQFSTAYPCTTYPTTLARVELRGVVSVKWNNKNFVPNCAKDRKMHDAPWTFSLIATLPYQQRELFHTLNVYSTLSSLMITDTDGLVIELHRWIFN